MRRRIGFSVTAVALLVFLTLALFTHPWSAEPVAAESQLDAQTVVLVVDEEIEGNEQNEHDGDDENEFEMHRHHLELEMAELEANFGRLELVGKVAMISSDEVLAAAFAVTHVMEFMEPEEAVGFLSRALGEVEVPGIRRVIRIKLAEIYAHTDQPDAAKDQLRALIVGE